jgi:predicted enzyme related to lactoylglutathione lyase
VDVRLFRVIVPVADIHRAAAFYSRLFEDSGTRVAKGRHYFRCGSTILACYDPHADQDDKQFLPNPEHIYFAVDDLETMYARAQGAGCDWIEDAIQERPWGELSFYARDPFGNPICFVDKRTIFTGSSLPSG